LLEPLNGPVWNLRIVLCHNCPLTRIYGEKRPTLGDFQPRTDSHAHALP
jgi:hypothetical protein